MLSVGIFGNNLFVFWFSTLNFFPFCFLRDSNVVFFSVMIFDINSTFFQSCVNVCLVVFRYVLFGFSLFCFSIRLGGFAFSVSVRFVGSCGYSSVFTCWYISSECFEQYWTSLGGSTLQNSSYTATYHPSRKLSKLDEPDMRDTAREVGTSTLVMYSCGPLHITEQRQDNKLEPTYSSSVLIRDVSLKTCR